MTGDRITREANRAYWETEASVADIASRFDLSRRALYEAVEPLEIEPSCSACGGPLQFANRLARRTGSAICAVCGEREHVEGDEWSPVEPAALGAATDARAADVIDFRHADGRSNDMRQRAVLLGSAAIAGMAIGGVAAWLARRRD